MRTPCLLALAALVALGAGCSKPPYDVALVSGQVTLDGKPVANVAVMFQPVATQGNNNPGPGSTGVTDADGRYTLKLIGKETNGAVVGKHKVRITNFSPPTDDDEKKPRPKPAVPIPARYNDLKGMDFEVTASGTDAADFKLTTKE